MDGTPGDKRPNGRKYHVSCQVREWKRLIKSMRWIFRYARRCPRWKLTDTVEWICSVQLNKYMNIMVMADPCLSRRRLGQVRFLVLLHLNWWPYVIWIVFAYTKWPLPTQQLYTCIWSAWHPVNLCSHCLTPVLNRFFVCPVWSQEFC